MKKFFIYLTFFIIFGFLLFLGLDFLYPLDKDKLYRLQSQEVKTKKGEILRMGLSVDGFWRFDVADNEVPPLLKKSILLFEDRYFYSHFGINPLSITRAIFHNIQGKKTIGASTITMQVARMLQRRDRTYINKLIEMFNALQLEWYFSKDEILLFYLNLAPYGGNIEGIKAASYFYFQKSPLDLTIAQIALLTTIPKNPNQNRVDKQKNLKNKRHHILSLLYKNKIITKSQSLRANIEPIIKKRFHAPFYAPQYTNIALNMGAKEVELNLEYQLFIEKVLKSASDELKKRSANNAAALLIDNESMSVVAYVGSENFYSKLGQNDGVRALRSPGSTLKPFIYAKALEHGLITPKQELFDVPLHVGFYEPGNFNKGFMGIVRADEALQYSLNIPAVELNMLLGEESLYEMLKSAKVSSITKEKEYYGSSLALGGFGISLLDLTHLYTAFSHGGKLLPLRVGGNILRKDVSLFSNKSAWLVSEILSDGIRPELSAFWESSKDIPRIGFKTGTSADFKDLYTIGFTKKYTFGVWIGNFDGKKTENLLGIDTASKVVFEVFRYLNDKEKLEWFKQPCGVEKKLTCIDAIIDEKCHNEKYDFLIKGVAKNRPCEVLRGEVLAFLIEQKKIKSIQDLSKNRCFRKWSEQKPVFVYPYDKAELFIDTQRKIMLKCYSFNKSGTLFFQIDNRELLEAKSGEKVFVNLKSGTHEISCIDEYSRAVTNSIIIKER